MMPSKKFQLTTNKIEGKNRENELKTVYQIQALVDIPIHKVKKGDLGGWVEFESNLSHDGDCWIKSGVGLFDEVRVSGDVLLCSGESDVKSDLPILCTVKGKANIEGSGVIVDSHIRDSILDGERMKLSDNIIQHTHIYGIVHMSNSTLINCSLSQKGKHLLYLDHTILKSCHNQIMIQNKLEGSLTLSHVNASLTNKAQNILIHGIGKLKSFRIYGDSSIELYGNISIERIFLNNVFLLTPTQSKNITLQGGKDLTLVKDVNLILTNTEIVGEHISFYSSRKEKPFYMVDVIMKDFARIENWTEKDLGLARVSLSDMASIVVKKMKARNIQNIQLHSDEVLIIEQ